MPSGWRYLAFRLNGDGTETFLAGDLPLTDVAPAWALSGVDALDATIPVEVASLADSSASTSIFVPWSTVIYAELDGRIRAGCIVTDVTIDGSSLKLQADGFTGYLHGLPYVWVTQFVNADPLGIAQHIWDHVQGEPDGDIGVRLVCDPATSPIRLGKLPVEQWPLIKPETVNALLPEGSYFRVVWPKGTKSSSKDVTDYGTATRAFSAAKVTGDAYYMIRNRSTGNVEILDNTVVPSGFDVFGFLTSKAPKVDAVDGEQLEPYRLEWFTDADLGARWDDLATQGQFDYRMEHAWSADGTRVEHTLRIGYGGLGARREDLRFVVGENVQTVPTRELPGADFFSGVLVLGAGEGRAMVHSSATRETPRLRRPKVITDKSLRTVAAATRVAQAELATATADELGDVKQLLVRDHPNAPIGSWQVGDSIRLMGARTGWDAGLDLWVRVLEWSVDPDSSTATLTVTRTERSQA